MTTLEQELTTLLVFIVIAFVSYIFLRLHIRLRDMESDSARNKKDIEYLGNKILELRK